MNIYYSSLQGPFHSWLSPHGFRIRTIWSLPRIYQKKNIQAQCSIAYIIRQLQASAILLQKSRLHFNKDTLAIGVHLDDKAGAKVQGSKSKTFLFALPISNKSGSGTPSCTKIALHKLPCISLNAYLVVIRLTN